MWRWACGGERAVSPCALLCLPGRKGLMLAAAQRRTDSGLACWQLSQSLLSGFSEGEGLGRRKRADGRAEGKPATVSVVRLMPCRVEESAPSRSGLLLQIRTIQKTAGECSEKPQGYGLGDRSSFRNRDSFRQGVTKGWPTRPRWPRASLLCRAQQRELTGDTRRVTLTSFPNIGARTASDPERSCWIS